MASCSKALKRSKYLLGKRDSSSRDEAETQPTKVAARPFKRRRCWADEAIYLALRNGTEKDPHRLAQRQKQIALGKNTLCYDAFIQAVPREARMREHPTTPVIHQVTSKRGFDGQVKRWRRMLFDFKEELDRKERAPSAPARSEGSGPIVPLPVGSSEDPISITASDAAADVNDFDDEDYNDGIELDGDGNVVSMGRASESHTYTTDATMLTLDTPGGRQDDDVPSPEPLSVFGKF
jgi:hypothetical protein